MSETQKGGRHVAGYLGTNQMGKTHLMDEHAAKWQEVNPDARIFSIGKWKPGAYWIQGADGRPNKQRGIAGWEALYPYIEKLTNYGQGPFKPPHINPLVGMAGALVQFDDMDSFCPADVRGTPYHSMFLENAHLRLDVQFTAHRPQQVSKNILNACHYLYVFSMGENYAREYIESMPELRGSEVVKRGLFPRKRGQYVVIRNDPARHVATGADFVDGYRPELDDRETGT